MPPPPRNLPPPPEPMKCKSIPPSASYKAEEAKDILTEWAKAQCCGSAKAANEGHVTGVFSCNALQYVLETFTESRSIVANFTACRPGESIDAVQGGAIVNPWMLPCQPDSSFKNHQKRLPLPKTDVLQPCHRCNTFGKLRCGSKCLLFSWLFQFQINN